MTPNAAFAVAAYAVLWLVLFGYLLLLARRQGDLATEVEELEQRLRRAAEAAPAGAPAAMAAPTGATDTGEPAVAAAREDHAHG